MLAASHRLQVGGESMIGWCTANRQARIALDVGQEAVRFNNPFLPDTRSELALPIQAQNVVLGALTIQSTKPSAFDQDVITILQGVADSLASAIENARLFSEVQASLEEIQQLHHQYLERSWSKLLHENPNLEYVFENKDVFTSQEQRKIQMPILLRDQSIGQITIEADANPGGTAIEWKPEEIALIEAIATQAALALENARLLDEAQKQVMQEEQMNLIMAKSQRSLDLDTVMKTVVQEIGKSIRSSRVAIQLGGDLEEQPDETHGNAKVSGHRTILADTGKNGSSGNGKSK
jgi:GAF domain-containing protein